MPNEAEIPSKAEIVAMMRKHALLGLRSEQSSGAGQEPTCSRQLLVGWQLMSRGLLLAGSDSLLHWQPGQGRALPIPQDCDDTESVSISADSSCPCSKPCTELSLPFLSAISVIPAFHGAPCSALWIICS